MAEATQQSMFPGYRPEASLRTLSPTRKAGQESTTPVRPATHPSQSSRARAQDDGLNAVWEVADYTSDLRTDNGQYALKYDKSDDWDTQNAEYEHAEFLGSGQTNQRTGLPIAGNMETEGVTSGRIEYMDTFAYNMEVPDEAAFWRNSKSSFNQGELRHIPIQSGYADDPQLRSPQPHVSSQRLNQMMTDPETRSSPRIPARFGRDVPVVYDGEDGQPPVVLDGNHRLTSSVLNGKLFEEVRVLNAGTMDRVVDKQLEMKRHKANSLDNWNRNPDAEAIAQRRIYGSDY